VTASSAAGNDYRPDVDVRNGTRGTVEAVDRSIGSLLIRTDDGRRVRLPADYLEHAHHGYAITGHASQGATVDRTFLLASPERGSAEWGYVVASRHRIDLQVFLSGADRGLVRDELVRAWSRRQAKELVLDRMAPADDRGRRVAARTIGRERGPTSRELELGR